MTTTNNAVVLYQSPDGVASLDVRLDHETVWLTQKQMAELFGKNSDTIGLHIHNAYKEGELLEQGTTEESSVVQNEGSRRINRKINYYNLDVIISVGYRVKSQQGTRFRIWATQVLKDHIVKGYTVNEQRFREQAEKLTDMRRTVELLARTLANQELVSDTGKDVLRVIADYAYALAMLDRYDHGTLAIEGTTRKSLHVIDYEEAIGIVSTMKGEFDGLFGLEKDQGFKSALGAIYQTFVPQRRGKGGQPSLLRRQEPRLQRRQQTHRRRTVHLLPRHERHPLPPRRQQATGRQCTGGAYPADCREPA
jgi:hypothetical protein